MFICAHIGLSLEGIKTESSSVFLSIMPSRSCEGRTLAISPQMKELKKQNIHPPPNASQPSRNKALLRDYQGIMVNNKTPDIYQPGSVLWYSTTEFPRPLDIPTLRRKSPSTSLGFCNQKSQQANKKRLAATNPLDCLDVLPRFLPDFCFQKKCGGKIWVDLSSGTWNSEMFSKNKS